MPRKLKPFSVLLRRPDSYEEDGNPSYYYALVTAVGVEQAVDFARSEVFEADGCPDHDPTDYALVLVTLDHHPDLCHLDSREG